MLDHLGEVAAAKKISFALTRIYREGKHTTRDVGGKATTAQFADGVIEALGSKAN